MKQTLAFLFGGVMIASANSFMIGGGAGVLDGEGFYYAQIGAEMVLESDPAFSTNVYFEYAFSESSYMGSSYDANFFSLNYSGDYTYNNLIWTELGMGLGFATGDINVVTSTENLSDDDLVFAGQLFANIGFNIADHVKIYAGVKYYFTSAYEFFGVDVGGINDLAYQGGVRISF